jgi:imidazole glycerol phosphate synthase subunit HisF
MAYKRLVGVVAVKDGRVVKSYGYKFWRPAGRLRTALRNLDRWLADEILVLDISRSGFVNPAVVEEIRSARISTPLAYGGGIQSTKDVEPLLAAGCERFVLETMLFNSPHRVVDLAGRVGVQALIASLPLSQARQGRWQIDADYATERKIASANLDVSHLCSKCNEWPVAEVLAIDRVNEGTIGGFSLLTNEDTRPLGELKKGIIWFGGIDTARAAKLLAIPSTVAVAFGNLNFEKEVAMRLLRRSLLRGGGGRSVRKTYGSS